MPSVKELYKEHGYFSLLFEKMIGWEWYTDLPCFKMMVHLILVCMKHDTSYRGDSVMRGQYRTSLSRLSSETGLSVKQVRNAMRKLEKTNDIKTAKSRAKQRTIITLCNFEKYQPEILEGGKGRGKAGAKVGQRYNNDTNETSTKRFIEPTLLEVQDYMIERGVDPHPHGEDFIDHHQARGWVLSNRQKMKDWKAAARTWIGNIDKFKPTKGGNNHGRPKSFKGALATELLQKKIDQARQVGSGGGRGEGVGDSISPSHGA